MRGCVWKPLYIEPDTNHIVQHQLESLVRNWTRFTGVIDTRIKDDSLVILANLGFTDTMKINAASRKVLNKTKYKHHRMGRTW